MNLTSLLNVATFLLSSTALVGILFHDMRIDKAAALATGIYPPTSEATVSHSSLRGGHAHTHVHSVEAPQRHSVRPNTDMQRPRDEHRKNGSKKVQLHFGADNGIIWPSQ